MPLDIRGLQSIPDGDDKPLVEATSIELLQKKEESIRMLKSLR